MTKQEVDELVQKYRKILESGEPVFILRGQDRLASECVRHWCARASMAQVRPQKITEAWGVAADMEEWPEKKIPD